MIRLLKYGLLFCLVATSCQVQTQRPELHDEPIDSTSTLVDPKYSLSQDRAEFEKIRESIPENKRRANDEKALIAEWMVGSNMPPADVRERFNNLVQKKRETFNNDMTKLRESFSKNEKKNREQFLKEVESERDSFTRRKQSREARNEFFDELDQKRKNFFAEQREKRDEFESDMRDQRKNFEDYLKERSLYFTSELKAYTERWNSQNKKQWLTF